MATDERRTRLFRLGQLALLAVTALLLLNDFYSDIPLFPASASLAVAAVAVWLPGYRPDSPRLPVHALLLFGCSLAVTALSMVAKPDIPFGAWGSAETLGMLVTLVVVARRAPGPLAVAATVAGGVALAIQPLRSLIGPEYDEAFYGVLQALFAAGAIGLGAYLRSLDNARKRRLAAALAEQRAEFARDLHDFIAHHVTGIVVQAQGARLIAGQDPQRVIDALTQIEYAGSETMTAMRRMVGVLRDNRTTQAPVAPLAGIAELTGLAHRFTASGGPPVRLHIDGTLDKLPVDVDSSAYRIVLEALTNARRHASGASAVDVSLRRTPDWLLVVVTDDGTPPARAVRAAEHGGFGLAGIAERVKALGGRFHAGPGITGGWTVEATLPLRARGDT